MFTNTRSELSIPELVEATIKSEIGVMSKGGAIVVRTGKFTGRAADDKYVVSCPYSEKVINWQNKVGKISRAQATTLKEEVLNVLKNSNATYEMIRMVGADPKLRIKARLITQNPSQAIFFNNMLRPFEAGSFLQEWTVYHAPFHDLSLKHGTARPTAIVLDFEKKEVFVTGTAYAGEVKKALFSIMNTVLPDHGVLPMHSGANIGTKGDVSVFFGLSGTGKTTLSTDIGRALLGDDEHGLSDDGVFNFEGGCYAKTAKLSSDDEPQIHRAATSWGAMLENVTLKADRTPDFFDLTLTENGRASYPLTSIDGIHPGSRAGVAQDLFFLSADAMGVLAPVAKLNAKQAMEYFLCGYTSKLAGTEVGIKEPKSAFSYCFGAPFMLRPAREYAELLATLMERHKFNVWLINTGWGKGGYGKAERFPIKVTRAIIRSIQAKTLDMSSAVIDPVFGYEVPQKIEGIPSELLKVSEKNDEKALKLKALFDQELKKIIS